MKAILILIMMLFAAPSAEAQRYCGHGRWINGYFVCPPTAAERIADELRESRRVLREQQRVLKEINQAAQRSAAAKPKPRPQVIVIREPQTETAQKPAEKPTMKPAAPAVPDTIHRRKTANGTWHFSNVQ